MTALPPLLARMQGTKTRASKAPLARPKEIVLHMAVAKVLRDHALPSWQWCHIPSGEARDIRTTAKLKQMGVRRGWPDFLLVAPAGAIRCLELKRQGETLSDSQEAFQLWAIRKAVPYSVAETFDQALAILDSWGCLRIKIGGEQ